MNTSSHLSPTHSSPSEFGDEASMMETTSWQRIPPPMQATSPPINGSSAPSSVPAKAQTLPLQKRRRVTRACDECRRKKIKCDGKQPCTHCTVYSYECTYDQPSNRRRNPAPQYIEALETRLHRMEALLKVLLPDVDVNHPNFDLGKLLSQVQTNAATRTAGKDVTASSGRPPVVNGSATASVSAEKDSLLESMVEAAGRLDIDESGHMDFHGHSSGIAFLTHLNTQLSDLLGSDACGKALVKVRAAPFPAVFDAPGSTAGSPFDGQIPNTSMLPTREVAKVLLDVCMDDACVLMRFVHRPTFDDAVNRIYEKDPNDFGDDENNHLPLLYLAFSVGCIFSSDLAGVGIPDPVAEGTKYFNIGRRMIEITDCWDIPSIQCVIMMVLFLQSSARMSTCYSYLGIALSASVRMGLHRSLPEARFDPIERETRKRIFWTVRKMDTYVGALLGLPKGIADEDIDQEMPAEVDDEFITRDAILPQPDGVVPMILAANAHCNLLKIMAKMVKYIYPLKGVEASVTGKRSNYSVSSSKLGEIERDLQAWLEKLSMQLRPGGDTPKELQKMQYLLKMAFSHVQMMLYRPFLHYISRPKNEGCDERPYASAANCVDVSRKIVHTADEMRRLGILNGAYWFTMYTCFSSVITLVYFVLENPEEVTSLAVLRDAEMGRELLASMRDRSQAAKRCSVALATLFGNLPENLRPRLEKANLAIKKKRARAGSQTKASSEDPPSNWSSREPSGAMSPDVGEQNRRSRTFPSSPTPESKRQSMPLQPQRGNPTPTQDPDVARRGSYELCHTGSDFSSGVETPDQIMPFQSQLSGNGLLDLDSMMFQSPDPFSYNYSQIHAPHSTTYLERRQGAPVKIEHSSSPPESRFGASSSGGSSNPYDSLEVQLFGPLPPYLLQGQPQAPEGASPGAAGQDIRMIASSSTQPNFMGVTSGANGLGGFFGDEWDEILLPRQDNP